MVENLKRFRESAAWTVLAIVVAGLVLSTVRLVIAVTREGVPTSEAFQDAANSGLNLTMVALLVAARQSRRLRRTNLAQLLRAGDSG